MLRIAVQSKGRLYEDTMDLLTEAGIKLSSAKRTLLIPARNFPVEILFLRDDDIPDSVASGVADIGIVGKNEFMERKSKLASLKIWDSANADFLSQFLKTKSIKVWNGSQDVKLRHLIR